MTSVKRWPMALVVAAAAALLATESRAQDAYPDRPVRIVVGFAAGSSTDVASRVLAEELSKAMGQRFIVENRPGASSNIATASVAKAAPDGYTLLMGTVANAINTAIKKDLSFDFGKDFKPIALVGTVPNILVVHPSVEARNVQELISLAKARPGALLYGSPGAGTSPHLSAELFKAMAGVEMAHIAYNGSSQAVQDLVAGRIHVMFSPASSVVAHVEAGTLRALASTGKTPASIMPDLPTVADSGLPGFDTSVWFGLLAPAGTPDAIIDKLVAAVTRAVRSDAVLEAFRPQGIEPLVGGPEEFARYIADETSKWADVAVKAGLVKP